MSTPGLTMEVIREAASADRWNLTGHARERARRRHIGNSELVEALAGGEVLEHYPEDPRGPSALVLGYTGDGRPLHAVCALDPGGVLVVITVYEPGLPRWRDERTRVEQREEE